MTWQCPSCGVAISDYATCPKCGISNPSTLAAPPSPPSPTSTAPAATSLSKVVITGVKIPFGDLVVLLVKLALAAIPAGLILALVWSMVAAVASAVFIH